MQKAALLEGATGTSRACTGHYGSLWVPVAAGNGHWQYHWLTPEQAQFLRSRTEFEKYALLHGRALGCFVCRLQKTLERVNRFDGRQDNGFSHGFENLPCLR